MNSLATGSTMSNLFVTYSAIALLPIYTALHISANQTGDYIYLSFLGMFFNCYQKEGSYI